MTAHARTTAPYGSWRSPVTAEQVARGGHPVEGGRFVGEDVWWLEQRPDEGGRSAVRRRDANGTPVDVLPVPWNARTRVHEYGGGAWTVVRRTGADAPSLVFAEYTDQRLYRLDAGGGEPVPLTPRPSVEQGLRYAELSASRDGAEVWCVRESHAPDGTITRDVAAVPADGSAADDPGAVRSIVGGSHFLTAPRLSPDGSRLAWIAWEHPQMPWDGTELRVAPVGADGRCGPARVLMGSPTESVLQPEWADDDTLVVISDRTGWWNLYAVGAGGDGGPRPLCPGEHDVGTPMWQLGMRWHAAGPEGDVVMVRTRGTDTLGTLHPATGEVDDHDLGGLTTLRLADVSGSRVLLMCGGPHRAAGLRVLDLATGTVDDVRLSLDEAPPPAYVPDAEAMTFRGPGGRDVHAFVYPPRNPDFAAPAGERAPYVAFVHGGPTDHVSPVLSPTVAFFTSRGIGVVDVNYGGSSGYGRAYRERLRGQWGVVDVEDTVAAVRGLAEAGLADPGRVAIRGGSAGGWTVLAALTGTDAFACGASYFGVAELLEFARTTHDFEARYLDGLVGTLPEARELYEQRAPVNHVDGLSCPVLLLQGLDDPVVPPSQAEMFRDAMVRKGIPHAYLAFEGESHGFRRTATKIAALEAELSFYGQVLGFPTPGVPALTLVTS